MEGSALGRKMRQHYQHRERSDVKDPFHRPNRQLRRKGKVRPPRDQVRTNEFPRPPQQRQSREPNQRRRYQLRHSSSSGRTGFRKIFHRTARIT